jgi:thiamine pyrophosphokinase
MNKGNLNSILIIANGELPQKGIFQKLVKESDCIVAVDGGSNICYEYNIYPHFIIGDLDSIDQKVSAHFHDSEIIHLQDQNRHDLDKAIEFTRTLNPERIMVIGAFGKRLDHSLANLLLLQSMPFDCSIIFYDDYGQLSVIQGIQQLNLQVNTTVSLFSFLPVFGLSLEGFKYSLQDQNFPEGFNGLSNITVTNQVKILIKSGSIFLYIIYDDVTP